MIYDLITAYPFDNADELLLNLQKKFPHSFVYEPFVNIIIFVRDVMQYATIKERRICGELFYGCFRHVDDKEPCAIAMFNAFNPFSFLILFEDVNDPLIFKMRVS